jgi:hypothetical protein
LDSGLVPRRRPDVATRGVSSMRSSMSTSW